MPASELKMSFFSSLFPQPPLPHRLSRGVRTFLCSGDLSKENERDLEGIRGIEENKKLQLQLSELSFIPDLKMYRHV